MVAETARLEAALGYRFQQPERLIEALTHRSAGRHHNERLEFLGDSILSFVIADMLYHRFQTVDEGQLSRLRSTLVKGETLATLAQQIELGDYIYLGSGELKSGGKRRKSILADSFEALLGAIYLDSNEATVRQVIARLMARQLEQLSPNMALKDSKTRLQEFLQGRGLGLPDYQVANISGKAHCQQFTVSCHIENFDRTETAVASSRRKAEQQAATQWIEWLTTAGESL
ncbi:ribonuclease III [Ectothiorhodospiraceae bacterium BW-2]|nr:ribonuclease III [Ectothiorhodospiraceae bacterium BW-2]